MADELIGATDAARRLGLTSERIRQLAKAGTLPASAGRIGRQAVWRWRELQDWAVAQGRLGAADAGGRQMVRAWAPATGQRRRVVDEVMPWDGGRSYAHVRIWEPVTDALEPAVVVIGNLEDSHGSSATNRFEDVAMLVAARHLGPLGLRAQFYDHWSRADGGLPAFAHVTFSLSAPDGHVMSRARGVDRPTAQALGGVLLDPSWRATTVEEIERLVGEPVETYTPGTYTAAMVRAVRLADGAVEVRWDPEGALTAARAYVWLDASRAVTDKDSPRGPLRQAALSLLAKHAVGARERAAGHLTWQDPDAPVRLRLPDLPRAAELRAAADRAQREVSHQDAWRVVGAARSRLAEIDPTESQTLVPAQGGGLSRLAWWEAGIPEPCDDRDGKCGPIVTEPDLVTVLPTVDENPEPAAVRAIERAAVQFLRDECDALDIWDVPAVRPAGPFSATAPTSRIFLQAIDWQLLPETDTHRAERLLTLFDPRPKPPRKGRSTPRTGFDGAGRLVVMSGDGQEFTLEWPVGLGEDLVGLGPDLSDAVVRADAGHREGPQPVWIELHDGRMVPLPSHARWGPTHDYTWGYSGAGPSNLTAAVVDLAHLAARDLEQAPSVDAIAAVVQQLVSSGRTPAWTLRQITTDAATAR